jgi:hypothetical protein
LVTGYRLRVDAAAGAGGGGRLRVGGGELLAAGAWLRWRLQ